MNVTCREQRLSLQLLALTRRLADKNLDEDERKSLETEASNLEVKLNMD